MNHATVTTNRRLERGDGPLGGVAAGLADYFAIDPTIVRLGLVATTLLGGPTIPIAYLAAWLIIPAAGDTSPAPTGPVTPWASAPPPPPPPVQPADTVDPVDTVDTVGGVDTDDPVDAVEPVDTVDPVDAEADETEHENGPGDRHEDENR